MICVCPLCFFSFCILYLWTLVAWLIADVSSLEHLFIASKGMPFDPNGRESRHTARWIFVLFCGLRSELKIGKNFIELLLFVSPFCVNMNVIFVFDLSTAVFVARAPTGKLSKDKPMPLISAKRSSSGNISFWVQPIHFSVVLLIWSCYSSRNVSILLSEAFASLSPRSFSLRWLDLFRPSPSSFFVNRKSSAKNRHWPRFVSPILTKFDLNRNAAIMNVSRLVYWSKWLLFGV